MRGSGLPGDSCDGGVLGRPGSDWPQASPRVAHGSKVGDMNLRRTGGGMALLAAGLIAVLTASCAATPSGTTPPSAPVPTASSVAPSTPLPVPTPSAGPVDPESLVMEQLFLAIGNPDTGSTSEAWTAFNGTLKAAVGGQKDEARIRATAKVVLDYLEAAQSALNAASPAPTAQVVPAPTPPLVPWDWKQEWGAMLAAIGEGVVAMRDGGLVGDANAIALGSSHMNNALLDHFYPPNTWTMPDGRTFYASGTRLSDPPGQAFDRRVESSWSAGDRPLPQWIEADLGRPTTIEGVRLLTSQPIDGATSHRVTGRTADGKEIVLAEFDGTTADNQWLAKTMAKPVADIRYVRVTTATSPFLAAWREIEILSPDLPLPTMIAMLTPPPMPSAVPVESRLTDGRVIRASSATPAGPPAGPFDGDLDTTWNSGGFPVAWIEIDFGKPVTPKTIRLMASQLPNTGHTVHTVYGRAKGKGKGKEVILYKFDGTTNNGEWMSWPLAKSGPIRYLRIETTSSPSWVSWIEIEVTTTPD
jgi:hypothetical protein